MRSILLSCVLVCVLDSVLVSCQQDLPLWSGGQAIPRELLRPFLLEAAQESDSSDYEGLPPPKSSSSSSFHNRLSNQNGIKKRVAMGVDLPDYIMNYRGKSPDLGSFRERMQLSGRRFCKNTLRLRPPIELN